MSKKKPRDIVGQQNERGGLTKDDFRALKVSLWSTKLRGFHGARYGAASRGRRLSGEELERRKRELEANLPRG